jgi:hypothetical protein
MLLKIYQYLDWADKKLHSVFYVENKDQINEDLLSEFRDGADHTVKTGVKQTNSKPKT